MNVERAFRPFKASGTLALLWKPKNMLDTETKRRIDTCRDILVGKVPDPKSQVEQITIALIYKFMSDMDAESVELGGKRKFFAGDYRKYDWTQLMAPNMGGHDVLHLYSEAITKMSQNTGLPELFRDIFKNAFLPYRDPETLRSFLKEIHKFTYDHSEKLGDAFEYLLSVLGSQGDAGQFRTPRHIIDFMVEVIDPKKNESILDPACGTAGFLISSYKHIRNANTKKKRGDKLTADDKKRLVKNIRGYDISPDMVRLSLVNLYLHGFTEPHIEEYDTLTSEEKWNELYDVILANPPFMSPKGGIKPHKRFTVQAKRSEVLFMDYIVEHLTPTGRAAVIVPEGIIFQSGTAYKALRKMLVEQSLVVVVSLPAGVFQPYSGVKTSILIMDRRLAKKRDDILFVKIENDGFGLGAQRREVPGEQLTETTKQLKEFFKQAKQDGHDWGTRAHAVLKKLVAENGEYNLSGERYKTIEALSSDYPFVPIGELCVVERGASPRPIKKYVTNDAGGVNWIKIGDAQIGSKYITETKEKITSEGAKKSRAVKAGDFILSNSMSFGRPYVMATDGCIHDGWLLLRDTSEQLDRDYLYHVLGSDAVYAQFQRMATGGVVNNLNSAIVRGVQIPLPPLEVQKAIVAEIEGYQKVIDGARAVLENYRPHIPIHPDWQMVELGEIIEGKPKNGYSGKPVDEVTDTKVLTLSATTSGKLDASKFKYLDEEIPMNAPCRCRNGDIYLQRGNTAELVGTAARFDLDDPSFIYPDLMIRIRADESKVDTSYLLFALQSEPVRTFIKQNAVGAAGNMPKINQGIVLRIPISLPPLEEQQAIVAEIETEQALVEANRELIDRFGEKIKQTIARVWGET